MPSVAHIEWNPQKPPDSTHCNTFLSSGIRERGSKISSTYEAANLFQELGLPNIFNDYKEAGNTANS
jgi:hypothetical protein